MTTALPGPPPCPWFLPAIVKDMSAAVKGTLTTYFLECGRTEGHDELHRASNGMEWDDAKGRLKRNESR